MARACLVACAQSKRPGKESARELYTSTLFRKAREVATRQYDKWYILSAKYGLVHPDGVVESYDLSLNNMPKQERERWANTVFHEIQNEVSQTDSIYFFAGVSYREKLVPLLKDAGYQVYVPMEGLSIGHQLRWLNAQLDHDNRLDDVNRFYALLKQLETGLGGPRIMKDCTGKLEWPKLGVYFFFEPKENRQIDPKVARVVRVGTHAVARNSRTRLWTRLRTHRGSVDGSGNHRGSVFRLHVGEALLSRSGSTLEKPSWGRGQSASKEVRRLEEPLELEVSKYIGRMSLLWLAIEDEPGPASDRAYIERNCIGLIVGPNGPVDLASSSWLGRWSPHARIRASGMWNVDHISYVYDHRFIGVLEEYIEVTLGHRSPPPRSIAPYDWYFADKGRYSRSQISIFNEEL